MIGMLLGTVLQFPVPRDWDNLTSGCITTFSATHAILLSPGRLEALRMLETGADLVPLQACF